MNPPHPHWVLFNRRGVQTSIFCWKVILPLILIPATSAQALEGVLPDDTVTSTKNAHFVLGNRPTLSVNPTDVSWFKFNLSSLPADTTGSQVANATLKLFVTSVDSRGTVNVHAALDSWNEQTLAFLNLPKTGPVEIDGAEGRHTRITERFTPGPTVYPLFKN